jgi:DNA-binding CsgD family transcriptional regulator
MTEIIQLTKREKEVAELLLQSMSNKQIALALGISESTVEFHLKNLYIKLHVESRMEAFKKLRESTAIAKPRKSTVDKNGENANNSDEPVLQMQETSKPPRKTGMQEIRKVIGKYKTPVILGMLLVGIFLFVLSRQIPWSGYEREFEHPDEYTVGQTIERSNASGSNVHGQLGTTVEAPWPAQFGYVIYNNIKIPKVDQLYLKIRYSKDSPASVPVLIYLDDEPNPRMTYYPTDLGNWNTFVWTEPILLGSINSGVHSILFYTQGQPHGVADLDIFILTASLP